MHALLHPMCGHQGNRRVQQTRGVLRDAPVTSIGYWNLVASWSECRPNTRPVVSASDAGVFHIRNLASPFRPRGRRTRPRRSRSPSNAPAPVVVVWYIAILRRGSKDRHTNGYRILGSKNTGLYLPIGGR